MKIRPHRLFIRLLLFLPALGLVPSVMAERPNIVYILADDLGYGDVAAYNPESRIATPRIDQLAREGMRFTDAHTASSVCTPTRYGVMTGRYPWRSSMKQGVSWSYGKVFLEPGRATVGKLLQAEGYRTAVIGKWHLGLDWTLKEGGPQREALAIKELSEGGAVRDMDPEHIDFSQPVKRGPRDFGFDYSFILPASLDIPPYCYLENQELVEPPTSWTEGNDLDQGKAMAFWRPGRMAPGFDFEDVLPQFTRRGIAYIEEQAGGPDPFFLFLPLAAPHTPWVPTENYRGESGAGLYGDFVQMVDEHVGRILDAIEAAGIADNTLVIFTSDNGPYWRQEYIDRFGHRASHHFRGMKGDVWEGGHRVPFIVRWPGKVAPGSVSDALTSTTHFLATCADLLGHTHPNAIAEDSYSILPVLLDRSREVPGQTGIVMHSSGGHFAYREGEWKYIEQRGSGGFTSPASFETVEGEPSAQLYNLAEDPGESDNRFFRDPDKVAAMTAGLEAVRNCD